MSNKNTIVLIVVILIIVGLIIYLQRPFGQKDVIQSPEGEMINVGIIPPDQTISVTSVNIGDPAPNFRLQSFTGAIVELNDLKGQPIMIDFWANWCPFCHTEFPEIEKAYQQYKSQGLLIYGIHRSDTESQKAGQKLIDKTGTTFPLLKDVTGEVYKIYSKGRPSMPLTIYIDKNGIIQDKSIGPKILSQIEAGIDKIIK